MDISVIIVSWNVKGLLEKCLESIFKHTQKENTPAIGVFSVAVDQFGKPLFLPDEINVTIAHNALPVNSQSVENQKQPLQFEIIVVDNASSDGTVEMLEENFDVIPAAFSPRENREGIQESNAINPGSRVKRGMTIKLIRNSKNLGFAAANNQGIGEARGKYILLLNPDTEFTENSLKKVFDRMESDPSIGVLGCKLLNPNGSLQPSVRRFPRVRDIKVIFFKLYKLFPSLLDRYLAKDFNYSREQEVDQVMGAFFCIRRSVIDQIGLLDDKYFIWFEEVDFCRRAKAVGFKVVYWPGTSIIHHAGQSFGQAPSVKKQWWFFRSAWRYFFRLPPPFKGGG
ncbi:MAG: glycosyltransferase family 2 protein [Parcubacteria group bacterium]|nr:glycosyltransferase family 2 protein [Parcubacteria group bacterium]